MSHLRIHAPREPTTIGPYPLRDLLCDAVGELAYHGTVDFLECATHFETGDRFETVSRRERIWSIEMLDCLEMSRCVVLELSLKKSDSQREDLRRCSLTSAPLSYNCRSAQAAGQCIEASNGAHWLPRSMLVERAEWLGLSQ